MAKRALNNLSTNLQQFGINVSLKRTADTENVAPSNLVTKRYKSNLNSVDSQENCQQSLGITGKIKLGLENLTNVRPLGKNAGNIVAATTDKIRLKDDASAISDPLADKKKATIDSKTATKVVTTAQPKLKAKRFSSDRNRSKHENSPESAHHLPPKSSLVAARSPEVAAEVEIQEERPTGHTRFFVASDLSGSPHQLYQPPAGITDDVEDYDRRQLNEIDSEPNYAYATFDYYFRRECDFVVPAYLPNQPEISRTMRAILIDWIVEVQEVFQLNHETIYQAVKIVDLYLSRQPVSRRKLQLLGCTALFISAKYDERVSHNLESFIFVCDNACTRAEVIQMERAILKELQFDIGFPLSYRFLRRFARCAKITMELLTFARYILEMSLMEYEFVCELDSKMAAASLLLAIKSKQNLQLSWNSTLQFYSRYSEEDLIPLMNKLNQYLQAPLKSCLKNIKQKYSSVVFFSVAKIPLYPISK